MTLKTFLVVKKLATLFPVGATSALQNVNDDTVF